MNSLPSFDRIADNLEMAREDSPPDSKSVHWDVFPPHYCDAVRSTEYWPYFLRNALSYGFNDSLNFSNQAKALMSGRMDAEASHTDVDPYRQIRTNHDYRPLLPERLNVSENRGQMEKIRDIFLKVVQICGVEFVLSNLSPPIGSPSVVELTFSYGDSGERAAAVNYHDLYLTYYAWLINQVTGKTFDNGVRIIVEIGAGYGGLAAKLKDLNPGAKVIVFDLPEINAVQTYYLTRRFPACEIRLYDDFKRSGVEVFHDRAVDFIVLPGWSIKELPGNFVDLAVNVRSMMEMNATTIDDYFRHLHRTVRPGGLFACFNRYTKEPGNIRIKNYPYDDRWKILLSQTSNLQSHIHELVTQRTEAPQKFTLKDALRSLPPF